MEQWDLHLWQFVTDVWALWLSWLGALLLVEPLLEHWAPRLFDRLRTWPAWQSSRRHTATRWVGVILLFVACYQAWETQYDAALEAHVLVSPRELSEAQKARLAASLSLPVGKSFGVEINAVPGCDDCEQFAEDLRGLLNNTPGWRAGGGVINFAQDAGATPWPHGLGIHVSPDEDGKDPLLVLQTAFTDAGIPLPKVVETDAAPQSVTILVGRQ